MSEPSLLLESFSASSRHGKSYFSTTGEELSFLIMQIPDSFEPPCSYWIVFYSAFGMHWFGVKSSLYTMLEGKKTCLFSLISASYVSPVFLSTPLTTGAVLGPWNNGLLSYVFLESIGGTGRLVFVLSSGPLMPPWLDSRGLIGEALLRLSKLFAKILFLGSTNPF
jgi:hypothetical protein